jgi:hypothetical protein
MRWTSLIGIGSESSTAHQCPVCVVLRYIQAARFHVRFGSLADIEACSTDVCFTPESGHSTVLYWWAIRNGCNYLALMVMEYSDHRHLALIARRIAELESHIERQRQILADLEKAKRSNGEIAEIVRDTLGILALNLERQVRDRKRTRARMRAQV